MIPIEVSIFSCDYPLTIFDGCVYIFIFTLFFLIGFIPGFYISFLYLKTTKTHTFAAILLSIFIGSLIGILSFTPIMNAVATLTPILKYIPYITFILPAVIPPIEIIIIVIHYIKLKKHSEKKKNKKIITNK